MQPKFEDLVKSIVDELTERSHGSTLPGPDPPLPLDPGDLTWFKRAVDFRAPDLLTLSPDDIRARFPATSPSKRPPVNNSRLVTTLIWQVYVKARAGLVEPIHGNVRSFWYQHVQNFYRAKHLMPEQTSTGAPADKAADKIIDLMGERLEQLVYHRIFRYRDELQFSRPLSCPYLVGSERPGLLFFTEKEGLWDLCHSLHGQAGEKPLAGKSISVMASNGQPSYLALEYLAQALRERGVRELRIGCLCDYDPWGYCIAQSLDEKMRRLGFVVTTWLLTTENLFSPATLLENGDDMTQLLARKPTTPRDANHRAMIYSWFRITDGVDHRPMMIHVDNAKIQKRVERAEGFFKDLIANKTPRGIPVLKPGEFDRLKAEMKEYLANYSARWLDAAQASARLEVHTGPGAETHGTDRDLLDGHRRRKGPLELAVDWYR